MGQMWDTLTLEQILKDELEIIKTKRKLLHSADSSDNPTNLFGIALSGGGVRSATINLGILEVFNKCGILKLADYLSTVSGGGYIGSYIHARLKGGSTKDAYSKLFSGADIEYLKEHGDYLIPGKGFGKTCNRFKFGGAFLFSVLMNWVWALSLLFLILFFLQGLFSGLSDSFWPKFGYTILTASVITASFHFFFHYLARSKFREYLYFMEGLIFALIMLYGLYFATQAALHPTFLENPWRWFFLSTFVFGFAGLFANPNVITLHAFYRDRISETYLKTKSEDYRSLKLSAIIPNGDQQEYCAPYPLINCCLNLLGESENYTGIKTSDYFLLSPLYCGSKLTGYIPTNSPAFDDLMLSTAVAVSGAAVNPNMGTRTNRVLAFFMTLLNLRLGYWTFNPKKKIWPWIFNNIIWWPYYHVMELLCKTDAERRRVNISAIVQ